jgi:hypothetical protein
VDARTYEGATAAPPLRSGCMVVSLSPTPIGVTTLKITKYKNSNYKKKFYENIA